MSNFEVPGVFAAVVAGSFLKHVGLRLTRNRNVKEYVGTVSQINVYPLKSAKNLQNVTTANITTQGLICDGVGDRHWMVTRKGHYQNMSAFQRLILIQTTKEGSFFRLDAEGMEPLRLPLDPEVTGDNLVEVKVKFVPQRAVDCGDAAAQWISTFLKKEGLRLNYSPPSLSKRFSTDVPKEWTTDAKPGEEVAFQDFAHCMIMCDSSVEELSKRVQRNVPAIQFRPNVLVSGTTPFDENFRVISESTLGY
ncbi:MARC1-like protein [Mya arenaria]|uniref:MARC1-like protein n=1 Tax=Mya arenaria TaxID=6604 RepID=A0ABY7FAM3_MYAAR|nr:MARC1-like protein [Mya arenaria]